MWPTLQLKPHPTITPLLYSPNIVFLLTKSRSFTDSIFVVELVVLSLRRSCLFLSLLRCLSGDTRIGDLMAVASFPEPSSLSLEMSSGMTARKKELQSRLYNF